jgi:hypothetical protein
MTIKALVGDSDGGRHILIATEEIRVASSAMEEAAIRFNAVQNWPAH